MSILHFELVRYHIEFRFCMALKLDTSGVFKNIYQYSKLNNFCMHYDKIHIYVYFDKIYVIWKEFSAPFVNSNKNCMLSRYKDLQNVKISFILKYPQKLSFYFLYFFADKCQRSCCYWAKILKWDLHGIENYNNFCKIISNFYMKFLMF